MKRNLGFSLVIALSLACDLDKSSLGDLPEESATTGDESATDTAITISSGGDENDIGAPCQLQFTPESRLLDSGNPGCNAGMCLYAREEVADNGGCTVPEDCPGEYQTCDLEIGECILDPGFVSERSMCTNYCEVDDDCAAAPGSACESGFVCAVAATLGPDCCEKVCVCADDADPGLEEATLECAQGVAVGCCDQTPRPPSCGE